MRDFASEAPGHRPRAYHSVQSPPFGPFAYVTGNIIREGDPDVVKG
jgi:hypothetical protein